MFLIIVYVHVILLAGKTNKRKCEVKEALFKQFQVLNMGALHYFLGIKACSIYECISII